MWVGLTSRGQVQKLIRGTFKTGVSNGFANMSVAAKHAVLHNLADLQGRKGRPLRGTHEVAFRRHGLMCRAYERQCLQ
jgi:hypothetical protein